MHFSNSIRPSQCAVPFFVLVLFILPVVGKAQIKITGNTLFSKNEILTITGGRKSGVVAPGSIAALQREYYLRGYIFAKIRLSEGRDGESSEMEIEEGKQARFGRVNLRGSLVYDEAKIEQTMNAVPGQVFNPGILSSGIERLLGMYDEAGYPFIQVWVESLKINPESGTVDVSFFIMDGGKKNLAAVVIDGLSKTKEDLVVSLSGLKTGDTYSAQALKQAAGRLRALRVFTTVSAPRVVMTPDGKGVEAHFDVSEPVRTSLFRVALGYAKEEQQKPRVFNGLAELNLLNMGGRLMDLNLYWQNDGSGRSDTRILFQNRHFRGRALGLGLSLEQTGLDTVYTSQSLGANVKFPLRVFDDWMSSATFTLHADRNVYSEGDLRRSWRVRAGGGFSITGGAEEGKSYLYFEGSLSVARKKQYRRSSALGDLFSQYIVYASNQTDINFGLLRLHNLSVYRGIESREDIIPLSEQFYLGGAATLRGYRENQFHGSRVALSRWEIRFGRASYENLYFFVDGGYVFRMKEDTSGTASRENLFRAGYGFGIRTMTKLGDVDLSFGVGEKLSLQQTKVHVILGRRF